MGAGAAGAAVVLPVVAAAVILDPDRIPAGLSPQPVFSVDTRSAQGGTYDVTLTVSAGSSPIGRLHVCTALDPAGDQYLLALMDAAPGT